MDFSPFILTILFLLAVALVLAFLRLLRGPSVPDRVVAFDLLATIGIGLFVLIAIASDRAAFLDVALGMALILFLGTVGLARYLETPPSPRK